MSSPSQSSSAVAGGANRLATTQWSIVLAAGAGHLPDSKQALASLCRAYWLPVYAYVRRLAPSAADAQDLTQGFFVHLLETDAIARADPHRGRFRTFLLAAVKNFLANERDKARAQKRGGGKAALSLDFDAGESRIKIEPSHDLTPDKLYERRWVLALLDQLLDSLRSELAAAGKQRHFETLKQAIIGEVTDADYEQAAQALGVTAAAAKQSAYRLRKRYRELFRQEVARTVADESELDAEIGGLLAILSE